MKLKLVTLLFGIATITLSITTFYFYLESKSQTKTRMDRELTITNYKKVFNAIGKSGEISIDKLKAELKTEFIFDEKIGYNDHNKAYYYVLNPKKNEINTKEIWGFMGLELILDEQKNFKTISLYKP